MNIATNDSGDLLKPIATHGSPAEVFRVFLKLGLTSFGGPIAHLGYYREELVVRRKWIDEPSYVDLVALCQWPCHGGGCLLALWTRGSQGA